MGKVEYEMLETAYTKLKQRDRVLAPFSEVQIIYPRHSKYQVKDTDQIKAIICWPALILAPSGVNNQVLIHPIVDSDYFVPGREIDRFQMAA